MRIFSYIRKALNQRSGMLLINQKKSSGSSRALRKSYIQFGNLDHVKLAGWLLESFIEFE